MGIYAFIARQNPEAAARFVTELLGKVKKMAEAGFTGVSREDVQPGLRAFPYRDRCFYFRIEGNLLILLRVLHGAQDIGEHFGDEEG